MSRSPATLAVALAVTLALAATATHAEPLRTVERNGIKTELKRWQSCTALAPADWSMVGNEVPVGIGVDLAAGDGSMLASYGIVFVSAAVRAEPEQMLAMMATQALGLQGFAWGEARPLPYGYLLRTWTASAGGQRVAGLVSYRTFSDGMSPGYVLAYRSGMTTAAQFPAMRNVLYDVASSVRCQKRLMPTPGGGGAGGGRGGGSSRDLGVRQQEATMGFQNVYSPSTGEHWEASYSDYNAAGPDGAGYYRRVGNSYEKLSEGFPPD